MIPVFFRDTVEIREYFAGCLSSCRDLAEKAACTELLERMMAEDGYEMV